MIKSMFLGQFPTPSHYSPTYDRLSSYDEDEAICKGTQTNNHLFRKWTLNHLPKLTSAVAVT